jgi:hypothetical protein
MLYGVASYALYPWHTLQDQNLCIKLCVQSLGMNVQPWGACPLNRVASKIVPETNYNFITIFGFISTKCGAVAYWLKMSARIEEIWVQISCMAYILLYLFYMFMKTYYIAYSKQYIVYSYIYIYIYI